MILDEPYTSYAVMHIRRKCDSRSWLVHVCQILMINMFPNERPFPMRSLHQQEVVQCLFKVYEALRVNLRALRQDHWPEYIWSVPSHLDGSYKTPHVSASTVSATNSPPPRSPRGTSKIIYVGTSQGNKIKGTVSRESHSKKKESAPTFFSFFGASRIYLEQKHTHSFRLRFRLLQSALR